MKTGSGGWFLEAFPWRDSGDAACSAAPKDKGLQQVVVVVFPLSILFNTHVFLAPEREMVLQHRGDHEQAPEAAAGVVWVTQNQQGGWSEWRKVPALLKKSIQKGHAMQADRYPTASFFGLGQHRALPGHCRVNHEG